jgi:hypothetical protein
MYLKPRRFQSERYRRYVASKDCFSCGISGYSQCAHANGGGMGTKASDLETFPLCATRPGHQGCHMLFDLCIDMTKAERRELTEQYVARMQAIAKAEGRSEFMEAA